MPEHVTLKTIRDKRNKFYMVSALLTILISTMLIITVLFLFNFWLNTIIAFIISLVAYLTFLSINRIYIDKGTLARTIYIQNIFPIKETLTKQQYAFIVSDLDYIFDNDKSVVGNTLATLYNKLKMNNLSIKDIEKLNKLYSKEFVDLSKINR
jgi:uncharacterized metal-binding protein